MARPTAVTIERRVSSGFDQIKDDLMIAYDQPRFEVDADDRRRRARSSTVCRFGRSAVDTIDCMGGWMRGNVKDQVSILFPTRGSLWVRHSGGEITAAAGTIAAWVMPGQALELRTTAASSVGVLRLLPETLLDAGRALLGDDFEVRERTSATVPEALGHAFVRNAMFAYSELLDLDKNGLAHVVALSHEDTLTNLALALLYPDAFAASQASKAAPHAIVRRACEILDARASDPVSINGLAAELGVSVRALQLAFRKYRGDTPLQFLMGRRLIMARNRLLNPSPRDNVQAVAMGCGFTKMSQFASRYREKYGELPSATLTRVRNR